MPKYVAVDTETLYRSDYSVSDLGLYAYTHHPDFECYLVSFYGDGIEYVGSPEGAPWEAIKDHHWVSANAGFDQAVIRRCIELKQIPDVWPEVWDCSANMSVYFGLPRNLKGAVKASLDVTISKDIRDKEIKGFRWCEMPEELQKRVLLYGLDDAKYCYQLWMKHHEQWPEVEKQVSRLTYEMGERGLHVDVEATDEAIRTLERVRWTAERRIPWCSGDTPEKPLSRNAFFKYCRDQGVEPPKSVAATDEKFAEWLEEHGERFPWVRSIADFRRSNAILEKFKTLRERVMPNGRFPYSLLYYGAHTGRWSGAGGFNMQNMPREPFYIDKDWHILKSKNKSEKVVSADLRGCFSVPEGKKLIIADYAQIEARVTPWLAGDRETLRLAREGMSVYEIHARQSMGWTGGELKKESLALYQLAKARVLGLGFGCGWNKFITFAKAEFDKVPNGEQLYINAMCKPVSTEEANDFWKFVNATTKDASKLGRIKREWAAGDENLRRSWVNSWLQVNDFRQKNPKIVKLWKNLDNDIRASLGSDYVVELPNGRKLWYFNICQDAKGSIMAQFTKGEKPSYIYGGLNLENIVQATARDIIVEAKVRINAAGIPIVMSAHDEIVCEVDKDFNGQVIADMMVEPPTWAKSLPLGVEWEESLVYKK